MNVDVVLRPMYKIGHKRGCHEQARHFSRMPMFKFEIVRTMTKTGLSVHKLQIADL